MSNNLLIIEDNAQNLYLMRCLLERRGCEGEEAGNGHEGIEKARSILPRVILLDIQLPGMDGYAVAEELKRHPRTASIPIVAVTSYAMVGDRERILSAGADGYIEKPIDPDSFADEIIRYFPAEAEPGPAEARDAEAGQ